MSFRFFYLFIFVYFFSSSSLVFSYSALDEGIDLFNKGDYEGAKAILRKPDFEENIRAQLYFLASQGFEQRERSEALTLGLKMLVNAALIDTRHVDHVPAKLAYAFWNLYSRETFRASKVLMPQRRYIKKKSRREHHHQRQLADSLDWTHPARTVTSQPVETMVSIDEESPRAFVQPTVRTVTSRPLETIISIDEETSRVSVQPKTQEVKIDSDRTISPLNVMSSPGDEEDNRDTSATGGNRSSSVKTTQTIVEGSEDEIDEDSDIHAARSSSPPQKRESDVSEVFLRSRSVTDDRAPLLIPTDTRRPVKDRSGISEVSSDEEYFFEEEEVGKLDIPRAVGFERVDIGEILEYVKGGNYFPIDLFSGTPSEEKGEKELHELVDDRNHHGFYFLGTFYLNDKDGNSEMIIQQRKGLGLGALLTAWKLENATATGLCKQFVGLEVTGSWAGNCDLWCLYNVPIGSPRLGCGGDSSGSWWNCGLGLWGFKTRWDVSQLFSSIRNVSRTTAQHLIMVAGMGLLGVQQLAAAEVIDLGDKAATVAGWSGMLAAVGAYLSAQNDKAKAD